MSVSAARLEDARRRMLAAQQALRHYEERLSVSAPDRKRFRQLYVKAQVYTEEYLGLLTRHLRDKYSPHSDPSAKGA